MKPLILLIVTLGLTTSASVPNHKTLSDELIDYVNSRPGGTWRAAKTKRFRTEEEVRKLLGALPEPAMLKRSRPPAVTHEDVEIDIPEEFNASVKWPECKTIMHIPDQSSCGSCWAFGAVTAMSDRLCTLAGIPEVYLSATDLLACCEACGYGCVGGWVGEAWYYWRDHGIVTGGDFNTSGSCRPYPFKPCGHHSTGGRDPCPKDLYPTPSCEAVCAKDYRTKYEADKYYAEFAYPVAADVKSIQKEIWLRGPVEAAFNVYADFPTYTSGVYQHTTGKLIGGHAIRIIGWGVEKETPYWLVANSWNVDWGDRGFFKILRGVDHCGIESDVFGGTPLKK